MNANSDVIHLTINALGSHGEGIGRHQGCAVFVAGALPGETVKVRLVECHKNYARAELLEIIIPSPHRVNPPCHLFEKCGGCQLMHLKYSEQLEAKAQRVLDSLQRIGKLASIDVLPCIASPSHLKYRNKIQLPVKQTPSGLSLGLYAHASHHLIEVDQCLIHCHMGDEIYREIRSILEQSKITAYQADSNKGLLRHLLIKSAVHTHQALVLFVTSKDVKSLLIPIVDKIMSRCKEVKGVIQNVNSQTSNVILGDRFEVLAGSDFIEEKLGHLTFKISAASFFQVNPEQALQLYKKAIDLAEVEGHETLLDAYCGVGTLALFFSSLVKNVIGVECVEDAINNAKQNALINDINNVKFICNDTEKYLFNCPSVDIILLNPPRKGCALGVLKQIKRIQPKKIIYISCDPSTLARDLALFVEYGYHIKAVQPFDMFPQTAHVETVVSLTLQVL